MLDTKFQKLFTKDVEIFKDCSEQFIQDIFTRCEKISYLPGEIIRHAGRSNKHVFVVVRGSVNVVDGNDTVLTRNDVVGIYSHIHDLGFCVYTSYAARKGAICIRITNKLLDAVFKRYPKDKKIVLRNTLNYVNRRPRAHILSAMQLQVNNSRNQSTNGSMNKFYGNIPSDCENITKSMKNCCTLEKRRVGKESFNEIHVLPNAVLTPEHAHSIAQINSEKSESLAQEIFQKTRCHSSNIGDPALFYSNVNSQEKSESAIEYVRIRQIYDFKFGPKFKICNFRCMCLSCWVMVAVYVTWVSNVSPFH